MPEFVLLFFDISAGEIFIILIIAFLIFGPSRFPELARKIGKTINEMKRASESIRNEIRHEVNQVKDVADLEDRQTKTEKKTPKKDKEKKEPQA